MLNSYRRCHGDDVLFVLALVVPALFAGQRFFESRQEMAAIAQAQQARAAAVARASDAPRERVAAVETIATNGL
jgi:hypothetical protein